MAEEVKIEGTECQGDNKTEFSECVPDCRESKSWEEQVDEAYTDLVSELQVACESHVKKVRSQLRKMIMNSAEKPEKKPNCLFGAEETRTTGQCSRKSVGCQRTSNLAIWISLILLLTSIIYLTHRVDRAVDSSESTVSVLKAISAHGKLDSISYKLDDIMELLTKIEHELTNLKRNNRLENEENKQAVGG